MFLGRSLRVLTTLICLAVLDRTSWADSTPSVSADQPAGVADRVIFPDGSTLLGLRIIQSRLGQLRLVVRRDWLQTQQTLGKRSLAWHEAELQRLGPARRQLRERLFAWKAERRRDPKGSDPIVDWIDCQLDRLDDDQGRPTASLMVIDLDRDRVERLISASRSNRQLLVQGWRAGFADVETMDPDTLRASLRGRGLRVTGFDPDWDAVVDLLPMAFSDQSAWAVRRAATEVSLEPGLRLIQYQGLILAETSQAVGLVGNLKGLAGVGGLVDSLLSGQDGVRDRLAMTLAGFAARGRRGATVTELTIAPNLAQVQVQTTLWVAQEGKGWVSRASHRATVLVDRLSRDAGAELEGDPQVKKALAMPGSLGLDSVDPAVKQRALRMGAATQTALAEVRRLTQADLQKTPTDQISYVIKV